MAQVQLTNAGLALIQSNTGPVVVNSFQLGSAYNYTPEPTDTALHGTSVYTGAPPSPVAINANVVLYSIYVDYPAGPFDFGEFGLYVGATLFALGSMPELLSKVPLTNMSPGNSIRIDVYLSAVGTNYEMWLNLNQSNNEFRLAVLQSVDYLPPSSAAVPNAYIIQGVDNSQSAYLAYTDTQGLWNFDAYDYASQAPATITACDNQSITISITQYQPGFNPSYLGEVVAQFSTGVNYSICRYVSSAVNSGATVTIGFDAPLAVLPAVGDQVVFFGRQILSTTVETLKPATTSALGAIIVGSGLDITPQGVLSVSGTSYPVVSVNGQTGVVVLTASDLQGLAKVATTGQYSDLLNAPPAFTLTPATTAALGGVKAPSVSEQHLTIATDGTIDLAFNPVKTVNGIEPDPGTGNVVLPIAGATVGLINPTAIGSSTDLDSVINTGLYYITVAVLPTIVNIPAVIASETTLEVLPFNTTGIGGDVIQRLITSTATFFRGLTGSTWSAWTELAPLLSHTEQSITAITAGQSTFVTSGYPVGFTEVFLAGLRLEPSVDYTATNGTTVSIVNAALAAQIQVGAVLTVSSFPVFAVSNAVTYSVLAAASGATLVGFGATTVAAFLNELANGGATPAGTLTGSEIVGVSRGAGLLDTTTGAIAALAAASSVSSINDRTGAVTLELSDITGVGGAPIASPSFTGIPTAPTPSAGTDTSQIATTAFVAGNFAAINSPAFTGVPTGPTAAPGTGTTQLATTAFVEAAMNANVTSFNTRTGAITFLNSDITGAGGALIASPVFTGVPAAPTATVGTNTTQLATTAFVAQSKYYDVTGGGSGPVGTTQLLGMHVAARTLNFPANFVNSQAYALTAPTNNTTLTVAVNGTTVGTIVFAGGSRTATFTTSSGAFTMTPGQYMTIYSSATADTTFANVGFTLIGLAT
jgi:hypothetical protein